MKSIMHSVSIDEPGSLVRHRINFVSKLATKQDGDETDELINVDGTWHSVPGKDFQGLKAYLLLTCFDMLGQNDGPARQLSAFVYDCHMQDEDLRHNFYRFMNTLLEPSRRKELLNSVIITKKDKITDEALPCVITNEDKLQLLFDLRCSYMHKELGNTADEHPKELEANGSHSRQYIHMQWKPALFVAAIKETMGNE